MTAAPGRIFTQCPSKHSAALGIRPEHRHMDSQPRHAAAQVTLLEASFVFLPGLRRGENPSSEQHRQASKCCCRFASSSAEETDRIPVADQRSCAQPLRKQQRRGNGPHTGRRPAQLRAAASQAAAPRKRTAYWSPTSAAARSRFASSSAEETDRTGRRPAQLRAAASQAAAPRKRTAYRSPTSAAARSRPPRPPPPLGRWPQQQQRSGVQQQRRAPGSSSGERRAAAATESSLVQARTSSFKANIDPQPPSTVVEMARQQSGDQVRSPQRVGGHGVRPPRNLGLARACSMFSRVLFSFLSPFPLNCLRVACAVSPSLSSSLPLCLTISLYHPP
jgi:hypothetical protein